MTPSTVTVILTVLNDRRVTRTLDSLKEQTLRPLEVIVADGGSKDGTFEQVEEYARAEPWVLLRRLPGTVAETRNGAIALARGDIVAFIDADEVAPPEWLETLVTPIREGKADFTGGPTPALSESLRTISAVYYNAYLNWFYDHVAARAPHSLPMGNSAWRAELFRKVGPLNTIFLPREGGEDLDFAIRVVESGGRGTYVPAARVSHDYTGLTLGKLASKQAAYATAGYLIWRRHKRTSEASLLGELPYVVPPGLALVGVVLLLLFFPVLAEVAWALASLSFAALFVALLVQGALGEKENPGWRFRPVEIVRRWATLYGAFRGMMRYGTGDDARASHPEHTEKKAGA
jgi:cellulose synthase/poly-beta-1,6-N-acetylglucosamine synthase-like glycosyltransferase